MAKSTIVRDEVKRLLKDGIKDIGKYLKKEIDNLNKEDKDTERSPAPKGQGEQMRYGDLDDNIPLEGTNLLTESETQLVPTTIIVKFRMNDYPRIKNLIDPLKAMEEFIRSEDVQIELHETHLGECEVIDVIQQ